MNVNLAFRTCIIAACVVLCNTGYGQKNQQGSISATTSLDAFVDNGTDILRLGNKSYPSPKLWINHGATIEDGERLTHTPPPPHRFFAAENDSMISLQTPVIHLSRLIDGKEPPAYPGGASIESLPINLLGKKKVLLCFSYHRAIKQEQYERGWSDSVMVGPEIRVIRNGDSSLEAPFRTGNRAADELQLDFVCTSDDGQRNVFDDSSHKTLRWTVHPRSDGQSPIVDNPALSIFGGGGYRRGFHEKNKDSALTRAEGLRSDIYDDGKDAEWNTMWVMIPDTFLNAPNNAARNFRFRLAVAANNHGADSTLVDDSDDFFVKNIRIVTQDTAADFVADAISIPWPYETAPASQCGMMPLYARIVNNSLAQDGCSIEAQIRDTRTQGVVYSRVVYVPFVRAASSIRVPLPTWDARPYFTNRIGTKSVTLRLRVQSLGGDADSSDNEVSQQQDFFCNNAFSYFDAKPIGDVARFTTLFFGPYLSLCGLNLHGYQSSEFSVSTAIGDPGGSGSGEFAMRFDLKAAANSSGSLLAGLQVFFKDAFGNDDNVRFRFYYHDEATGMPGQMIPSSQLRSKKGRDDLTAYFLYDTLTTRLYDSPLDLMISSGTLWVSAVQLLYAGLDLEASAKRSGVQLSAIDDQNKGAANCNLILDKRFRKYNRSGQRVNDTVFAFRNFHSTNSLDSGSWQALFPTVGNLGYAHRDYLGTVGATPTYTRGSWMPMIQPYFRNPADTATGVSTEDEFDVPLPTSSTGHAVLELCNPSPVTNNATIFYTVDADTHCRIDILDPTGRALCCLLDADVSAGRHRLDWSVENKSTVGSLSNGMYFCRLTTTHSSVSTLPILVLR